MREVHPGVFVESEYACRPGDSDLAVVHGCKHPCHKRAVGYSNKLPSSHEHYLFLKADFDLYLNIIDPDKPIFKAEVFAAALRFSREHAEQGRHLLFHCNQGHSRAPSLALLHLAKNLGVINATSYELATGEFITLCPWYRPGLGIRRFLSQNWREL